MQAFNIKKSRRAFSLIEAAIVLGIVGLVIGGLWVAAESVQRKNRRQELISSILTLQEKLITLYPMSMPLAADCVYACLTKALAGDNAVLRSSAPSVLQSFFLTPANQNVYYNPRLGVYIEAIGRIGYVNGTQDMINWGFGPLDYSDCVWLAGGSATHYSARFYSLVANKYTGYEAAWLANPSGINQGVSPANAPTICASQNNWMSFRLMRP